MHSMRQRLGKNPLVNAEVKIFNLLVDYGSFSQLPASPVGHTLIISAPYLGEVDTFPFLRELICHSNPLYPQYPR